jgi:hypothetical protein
MIEQPVGEAKVDTFPTNNTVKDELFRYNFLKRLRTTGQPPE